MEKGGSHVWHDFSCKNSADAYDFSHLVFSNQLICRTSGPTRRRQRGGKEKGEEGEGGGEKEKGEKEEDKERKGEGDKEKERRRYEKRSKAEGEGQKEKQEKNILKGGEEVKEKKGRK